MANPKVPKTAVSPEIFKEWRNARRGHAEAQDMTNPFWVYCVQNELNAYQANEAFDGPSSFDYKPCWSFERFGMSETKLEDGRTIYIAGEHEDSYDPDFFIYNDVIVKQPNGAISIYGYPENTFPATDFHSATLVGDRIYLIGSLGYFERRNHRETPVYYLDLKKFSIHKLKTSKDPGWIYEHSAEYDKSSNSIVIDMGKKWTQSKDIIDNFASWSLDLTTQEWSLVMQRDWVQYRFSRKDGDPIQLFHIRMDMAAMDLDTFKNAGAEMDAESMALIKKK